jgi:hypothetical protein
VSTRVTGCIIVGCAAIMYAFSKHLIGRVYCVSEKNWELSTGCMKHERDQVHCLGWQ